MLFDVNNQNQTMARRGYRFMVPVSSDEEKVSGVGAARAAAAIPVPQRQIPARALATAGAVIVAILVAAASYLYWGRPKPDAQATSPITSLAVLPLTNLSGDPSQEYFSDGMTDAVITGLAQLVP
jgi:hypothetical protein